jgi:hypothetical protein
MAELFSLNRCFEIGSDIHLALYSLDTKDFTVLINQPKLKLLQPSVSVRLFQHTVT